MFDFIANIKDVIVNLFSEVAVAFEFVASFVGIFLDGFLSGDAIQDALPFSFGTIILGLISLYIARAVQGVDND